MSQELIGEPPGRITPRAELVNVFEVEAMAKRKLASAVYDSIAGGDRSAFDRITFRPRMLVDVQKMDLTIDLFGQRLFAPILIGPVAEQGRYHPEGEAATARGAAAARTVVVVSARSSQPLAKIAAAAESGFWYQVYPDEDLAAMRARVEEAIRLGAKAVVLTVGTVPAGIKIDRRGINEWRLGLKVPFLLKGVMSPQEAAAAAQSGVSGIVVSNHGAPPEAGVAATIDVLAGIVDAAGRTPVLVDGSFRRGTDVLKALALGARAVLIGRPAIWGLAAYGAEGVESVLRMMQSELARSMGLCGKPNIAALDRSLVKIHSR
jgi:4-hydroxymandelate oxidase